MISAMALARSRPVSAARGDSGWGVGERVEALNRSGVIGLGVRAVVGVAARVVGSTPGTEAENGSVEDGASAGLGGQRFSDSEVRVAVALLVAVSMELWGAWHAEGACGMVLEHSDSWAAE